MSDLFNRYAVIILFIKLDCPHDDILHIINHNSVTNFINYSKLLQICAHHTLSETDIKRICTNTVQCTQMTNANDTHLLKMPTVLFGFVAWFIQWNTLCLFSQKNNTYGSISNHHQPQHHQKFSFHLGQTTVGF